jgi:hypothetical protein
VGLARLAALQKPIIVRLVETPRRGPVGEIADVLVGAFGLTGVIVLGAVVLGAGMALILYLVRSRRGLG